MKIRDMIAAAGLLSAACGAAGAAGPALDFDRGFDLAGAMRTAARPAPLPRPARVFEDSLRATRDCAFFAFRAGSPAASEPVILKSYVYQTVCKGGECFEELLRTEKRRVAVSLAGAVEFRPWEKDVFRVCLQDTAVSAEVTEASHEYELTKKPGMALYTILAAARN